MVHNSSHLLCTEKRGKKYYGVPKGWVGVREVREAHTLLEKKGENTGDAGRLAGMTAGSHVTSSANMSR